tara:strand:- start:6763 stop:8457 length:1695 start_codon:yes stop_codon:yes gene_type:complete
MTVDVAPSKRQFVNDAIGVTSTMGQRLANNTAAALDTQQMSPAAEFEGQGWETDVGSSMSVKFRIELLPVQGAAAPTGGLRFMSNINDAGWNEEFSVDSGGGAAQSFDSVILGDGSVGTPSLRFTNGLDMGLYYIGADNLGVSVGGVLQVDVNTARVAFTNAILPSVTDGAAIGSATVMWSDVFLASGAVVNFDNGDVTLTHSAAKVTWGGDGAVEIDFNNHEMTNVDIDSGAIDATAIGGGTPAAGSFTTITGSGILSVDDTTDSTSTITGSMHTDGGMGIAKALWVGTTANVGDSALRAAIAQFSDGAAPGAAINSEQIGAYADAAAAWMFSAAGEGVANQINLVTSKGTHASPSTLAAGNALGYLSWGGYNDQYRMALAYIGVFADTGWAATGADTPTYMVFNTTPDGSSTSVEAARFTSAGHLALGTHAITMTGDLAATGARVSHAYTTDQTTTNAETVDSWSASKQDIESYDRSALDILRGIDVISFRHNENRDPSLRLKLGVRAESIKEPLALVPRDYGYGLGEGPGLDTMGLAALNTKSIQELLARIEQLEEQLALN